MLELTDWERAFIASQRVARLGTVDTQGWPHIVPIVYAFDGERLFTPVDAKPKRVGPHRLQRVRNIQANPRVTVLVDEYSDNWSRLAWVQIRGLAIVVEAGPEHEAGAARLNDKYPQYSAMPLTDRPIIAITVSRILFWHAADAEKK